MSFITKPRREVLETLLRHPTYTLKQIAEVLSNKDKDVTESAVRMRMLDLRRAYILAKDDLAAYEDYKLKLGWRGRELL